MGNASRVYNVLTANPKGHQKTITVRPREGATVSITLHRFALVGKGDQIRIGASGSNKISVLPSEGTEPNIPITPCFTSTDYIHLGKERIDIHIREITSAADLRALEFLEQFHYKTNSTLGAHTLSLKGRSAAPSVGGRRAILYAAIRLGEHWIPAGYIDLQMPLMMCKPRHQLFDHTFRHSERNIAWDKWNAAAIKKYLNAIVRIARIVVAPELRG
ncbi:MAG: hypothetical protein F4018_12045, partial [Acidobacteria bacterium]|nr:hypothetical protein [Acidobacteriota bacterium]